MVTRLFFQRTGGSERRRHSSGGSSTSSGVSSTESTRTVSPFSTLKTKRSSTSAKEEEASQQMSPGPRRHAGVGVKSLAQSPYGLHSVVYNFQASKSAAPALLHIDQQLHRTPMFV